MADWEVWFEAWPDDPGFSGWITTVAPPATDEHGHSPVGAMTCVPREDREQMAEMAEDLFRVFVNLPDSASVKVHVTWLDAAAPKFLDWLEE